MFNNNVSQKRKIITTLMLIVGLAVLFSLLTGCQPQKQTSDDVQRAKTERQMKQIERTVGMPSITQYFEKKTAKMIFEMRDKADLITYAYIITMTGKKVFLGKCIGYGLPYSVQYTNPMKMGKVYSGNSGYTPYTIPQADPNGLFMPEGLSATWLLMIDPKDSKPKPVYIEQEILVSPFPIH